jgi:hypothetical protein
MIFLKGDRIKGVLVANSISTFLTRKTVDRLFIPRPHPGTNKGNDTHES